MSEATPPHFSYYTINAILISTHFNKSIFKDGDWNNSQGIYSIPIHISHQDLTPFTLSVFGLYPSYDLSKFEVKNINI